MPSRYVRMDILTNGADKAKQSLEELYLESERLDGKNIDMDARLRTTDFTANADELKRKADILNKYRIQLNAKVGGTDVIDAKLDGVKAHIDSIYRKLDEKHDLTIGDLAKTSAELTRIKLELDRIPDHKTVDVSIRSSGGAKARAEAAAAGGSSKDDRSLLMRFLNRPPPAGSGGALSSALSGSPGQALTTPEIAGPLGSLAAMLLPSLTGLGVGAGVGGAGIGLSALFAGQATKQLKKDAAAVKAAPAGAQRQDAKQTLAQDTKSFAPFVAFTADVKSLQAPLMGIIAPFTKMLGPIITQMAKWLHQMGPELSTMFKASIPFVKAFVSIMEQGGSAVIPAFTMVMQEMVKSGALKLMVSGLVDIIKGLAQLIRLMGPEMRTSAQLFIGVCKAIQVAFNLFGVAVDYVTGTIHIAVALVTTMAKVIGGLLTGNVHAAWNAIKSFGKDVAGVFDTLRHVVSEALDNMGLGKFGHAVANTFDKVRSDAHGIWDGLWKWVNNRLDSAVSFTKGLLDGFKNGVSHVFGDIKHDVMSVWDGLWKWVGTRMDQARHFELSLLDDLRHSISTGFNNIKHDVENAWDGMWSWVGNRATGAKNFEVHLIGDLRTGIVKGFDNIRHDVASVWDSTWKDVENTAQSAVHRIGSILNGIKNAFNAPFAWVGNNVLEPLAKAWNWIGSHTGHVLPSMPTAFHLAAGGSPGRIMQGRGQTIDDVPALIGRDETVVSASHSRMLAPAFAAAGVPGYAAGGIPNPLSAIGHAVGGIAHDLGSVFGVLGRGALSSLEAIPGFGAISSIMAPIAKGAVGAAAKGATHLINGSLGTRPAMMTGAARATGDLLIGRMADQMATAIQAESAVAGNGATIAKYAEQFKGHPYVLGGSGDYQTHHSAPFGPWDCAGFVGQMYHHYGIDAPFPGINVSSLRRWAKFVKTPQVGGMAFWVTDGTKANPGHVGMVTGKNKSIQAMDPQMGTRDSNLAGALDFAVPPHGWGTATGTAGAVGKGYVNIGRGLMREGFTRGAAAGIVGDIAGESGGNPESVGSGGGGLIGWTPISSAPNKIITGNAARDMATQVADIKVYVERNGSMGDMNRFKDAVEAARHFSIAYERPAVAFSDVKPDVARSTYAALDTGEGWLGQGLNLVYNGLGRREHLVDPDRYKNQGGGSSGGECIHITVNGAVDGDATAKQIVQLINARARHNGGKTGIIQN